MTPLPRPLRELLDTRTTEGEILSVWKRIQERRHARRVRRPAVIASLSVAALLVLFVIGSGWFRAPGNHEGEVPLAAVGATPEHPLSGGDEIAQTTALSDGSRVDMRKGARLSVLENTGHVFVTHLSTGHADFSVKPGGPRRWVVECGNATVEVVGTQFSLERRPNELVVDVRHGVVLVRGEGVPDRVRRLTAGESMRVAQGGPAAAALPAEPVESPRGAGEIRNAPPEPAAPAPAATTEPAGAARSTSAGSTVASAATGAPAVAPAASLYEQADHARRSGHPEEAARLLESAVALEPRGHRAALACFTLGRLYLEVLGQPAAAAQAFERSLAAGTPRGLEEDARARLVEARARMSDAAGAKRAAAEYRAHFPDGHRADEVNRWSPRE